MISSVPAAQAYSSGIASTVLEPNGCNQCHTNGLEETIKLEGPEFVEPGATVEYQLSIIVRGAQEYGGLNAAASDGALTLGGEFESETRLIAGADGRDEVTHTSAKIADVWGQVEFTFFWTAPSPSFTSATLDVWGNGVDNSGDQTGDHATFISREILPASDEAPSEPLCATNEAPLKPLPLADPAEQKCQDAVGKMGLAYMKGVLKSVQKCLQDFQRWGLLGNHDEICSGSLDVPPSDLATAEKVAKAEAKALRFVDKKCTDENIAALDLCADTVTDFKTCFVQSYRPFVETLVLREFGHIEQTDDKALRKCQKVLSAESAKYVAATTKTMQKCVSKWNKSPAVADAAEFQALDAVRMKGFQDPVRAYLVKHLRGRG